MFQAVKYKGKMFFLVGNPEFNLTTCELYLTILVI